MTDKERKKEQDLETELYKELEARQINSEDKTPKINWSYFRGSLIPMFVGRALFSYLPLAVYFIFNYPQESDQASFTSSIFLSLGFVFIAQINNPFYAFFTKSDPTSKTLRGWVFVLYASKVFFGICSLVICASKSTIFNNSSCALILFFISLITLLCHTWLDNPGKEDIDQRRMSIENTTFNEKLK